MSESQIPYEGKLAIATPFYNMQANSQYVLAMMQTCRILERLKVNFDFMSVGDSYVGRARNSLCDTFLKSDCTDLFFVDSDEDWDVPGFFRVLMNPHEVVGASYRMKNSWDQWTASLIVRDGHPEGKLLREDCAILKAEFIPCGFMRLKRSALERFRDAYPHLRYKNQGKEYTNFFECSTEIDESFTGEDVTFCKRWRDIGGEIWVEPNVTITHYGMNGYEGNLDKSLRAGLKEAA